MQSIAVLILALAHLLITPLGVVAPPAGAAASPVVALLTLRLTPVPAIAAHDVPEWPVVVQPGADQPEPRRPETVQTGSSDGVAAGPIRTADDLLLALEHAGRDVRTLTAQMRHVRTFELQGDVQSRLGRVVYLCAGADAPRQFAVRFERLQVGQRIEDEVKEYVFDGQWLVERLPAEKLFIKRQVVGPGESFDPLRVGEGPFPLPIGQKRDDILSRFTARLVEAEAGLSAENAPFARECWQLVLTPRNASRDGSDFQEIRLWYAKDALLPRMARTVDWEGDTTLVQLLGIQTNEPIARELNELLDTRTPEPGSGWDVQIRPWREGGGS